MLIFFDFVSSGPRLSHLFLHYVSMRTTESNEHGRTFHVGGAYLYALHRYLGQFVTDYPPFSRVVIAIQCSYTEGKIQCCAPVQISAVKVACVLKQQQQKKKKTK